MIEKCQLRIQSDINNRLGRIRILLLIYSLLPSSLFNSFPLLAFALISILLSNFPQISVLPFSLFSFIIYSTISHITFLFHLHFSTAFPRCFSRFISFYRSNRFVLCHTMESLYPRTPHTPHHTRQQTPNFKI